MRGRNLSAASGAYTGDWGGEFPPLLLIWSIILNIYLRVRLQSDKSKRPWVAESPSLPTQNSEEPLFYSLVLF